MLRLAKTTACAPRTSPTCVARLGLVRAAAKSRGMDQLPAERHVPSLCVLGHRSGQRVGPRAGSHPAAAVGYLVVRLGSRGLPGVSPALVALGVAVFFAQNIVVPRDTELVANAIIRSSLLSPAA
jgi:hypothetical protein